MGYGNTVFVQTNVSTIESTANAEKQVEYLSSEILGGEAQGYA